MQKLCSDPPKASKSAMQTIYILPTEEKSYREVTLTRKATHIKLPG